MGLGFLPLWSGLVGVMPSQPNTDRTLRILLIVLAVLVLAPVLTRLLVAPTMGTWGGGMMGDYGMMGGGYGMYGATSVSPLWGIGMSLLWLGVLVVLGYLGYRWLSGGGRIGADPAMEELRVAYARGEVSEEEFEKRRAKLGEE